MNGAVEWVAVAASVEVNGVQYTAVQHVVADTYDNDGGLCLARARIIARCALEDTLRENHPQMSIREAFDTAQYKAVLTATRFTSPADTEVPF